MTFKELDLIEPILKALQQTGYTTPTPIQEQAIPVLLKGKDLLGCAQTGTGKTAAFAIPLIIRKSKFPQNPKRSVRFSGKRTKRSVQKRKARNTQKAETKVL